MMRRLLETIILSLACALAVSAQSAGDRICGIYLAKLSHNDAKVKVFRHDGGYRMQIVWLKEPKLEDGTMKLDTKNPDASKRKTPLSQVVLIDKVVYEDGIWQGGHIYDPHHGNTYKTELRLEGKTLEVRGKLGPFHKSMYWTKIE